MPNVQIHFEFHDWKEAFATYYENVVIDEDVVFIISTHPYSSGYWIESRPNEFQINPSYRVYDGLAVFDLEKRIMAAVDSGLPHSLIL